MKKFSAYVTLEREKMWIKEKEYQTKKEFMQDLKDKGYKFNVYDVKEVAVWRFILDETNLEYDENKHIHSMKDVESYKYDPLMFIYDKKMSKANTAKEINAVSEWYHGIINASGKFIEEPKTVVGEVASVLGSKGVALFKKDLTAVRGTMMEFRYKDWSVAGVHVGDEKNVYFCSLSKDPRKQSIERLVYNADDLLRYLDDLSVNTKDLKRWCEYSTDLADSADKCRQRIDELQGLVDRAEKRGTKSKHMHELTFMRAKLEELETLRSDGEVLNIYIKSSEYMDSLEPDQLTDEEWDSAETVEILSLNRLIDLIESKKLPNVNATNLVSDHKFSEIEKILGL